MGKIDCPHCQSVIRAGALYCEWCGLKIPSEIRFDSGRTGKLRAIKLNSGLIIALVLTSIATVGGLVIFQPIKPVAQTETAQEAKARREAEAEQWLMDKREKDVKDQQRMELARGILVVQKLREMAKVPESVRVVSATVSDGGAVCIEYRANNSFNAALRGFAIIDPYDQIYLSNIDSKKFNQKYQNYCWSSNYDITKDVNFYSSEIP
jgi:hypothetical protein